MIPPIPIDLSDRVKLRLRGSDRVRFLNGQVTNDVRKVDDSHAIAACICSLKGKLDGYLHITASGSGESSELFVDGAPELRADEALFQRLDRYLIADDVELEDVSADFALWHFLPDAYTARPDLPGAVWKKSTRFGPEGHDLWLSADSAGKIAAKNFPDGLLTADTPSVEALRIRHRVPNWANELSNNVLPAEAGLDKSAVDFHKGCYTGQEVISRIQSVGRVNRSLCLLGAAADTSDATNADSIAVGDPIFAPDSAADSKPVGHLTSIIRDPESDATLALAYLRRGSETPGTELLSRSPGAGGSGETAWHVQEVRST